VKNPIVISTEAPVSSVEDRNGGEVEKSINKQDLVLGYVEGFLDLPAACVE
jgi:hypothetical protein